MTVACLKCGAPAEGRFRPILGRGRLERLCPECAGSLSMLVRAVGEPCQLSLTDAQFVAWLETGRWPARSKTTASVSMQCPRVASTRPPECI